ncbi:MAG: M81 family metallopeptidase [Clostridia bacterium]|nr:M81 family metallopeptidase [Clostridia bacterium]MBQ4098989.1 M81 family metallopeptidase [Clostridia bacterium]
MKIIVASFQCESNSKAKIYPKKEDFEYFKGEDIFQKLAVKDIFESNGFEVIPSIYAVALPSATVKKETYDFYADQILQTVKENSDAKGVFIFFHGSMEVEEIGSGELYLLKQMRKFLSKDCLIALSLDAHANITDELTSYADIISGFKTVPHTDQVECQKRSAKALCYCLKNKIKPYAYMQRVPFLLKNDTLQTAYEPLKSLIEETIALESQDDVFTANLFLGHCWIDAPNTSASTLVCATTKQRAESIAKDLADKLWQTRNSYKFLCEAELPAECVKRALEGSENRIFITDSGDNTTAGAEGDTLDILKLLIEAKPNKKTCVAGITNAEIVEKFWNKKDGEKVFCDLLGEWAIVKSHGEILGWTKEIIGRSLTLSIANVDAVFTELRSAFIEKGNFDKANVDLLSYQIVVVKLGYLFTELKPYADRELFALSDGASCVELKRLNLKNILRPMFPLDDFQWKA